jgi:hypothetical protein
MTDLLNAVLEAWGTTPSAERGRPTWRDHAGIRASDLRVATPFCLTARATRFLMQAMHDGRTAGAINEVRQLAKLPSEGGVWIEWDNLAFFHEQERLVGTAASEALLGAFKQKYGDLPPRRGVHLMPAGDGWVMVQAMDSTDVGPMITPYHIAVSWGDLPVDVRRGGRLGELIRHWNEQHETPNLLWGVQQSKTLTGPLRDAVKFSLNGSVLDAMEMRESTAKGRHENDAMIRQLTEGSEPSALGLARVACWALALINEVPLTMLPARPPGQMRAPGGWRPFITNRVVEINLAGRGVRRQIREAIHEATSRRRAHLVRGHWRVSLAADAPSDRWTWRWSMRHRRAAWHLWITEHQRGDASLGWVDHAYEVKHGRDDQQANA